MSKKKRALFGFLVLAIAFLIAAPATAMDVEWPTTDPTYTLQDAINAAGEGGTITVKAGTHEVGPTNELYESYRLLEGQTIKGEGYDTDGLPVSKLKFVGPYKFHEYNGYNYAWGIWAGADNVTVDGLAFEGADLTGGGQWVAPIVVSGDFDAPVVTNATIIGNHILGPFPYFGIDLSNCMNSLISGNVIKGGRYGMYVSDHPTDVPPTGITISDNTIIDRSIGIYVTGRPGPVSGNTISGNTITGSGRYGIMLYYISNTTAKDNNLEDFTAGTAQIYVLGIENLITGNVIGKLEAEALTGIRCRGDSNNIIRNEFRNSEIPGVRDGDQPCVLLETATNDNDVFEQGDYPAGTGGATFQVKDMGGADIPNRVVGHPADAVAQQEDANPGIGDLLRYLAAELDAQNEAAEEQEPQ